MNWPDNSCDSYWEQADWLPPWYILDRWCQQDARCRQAKQQALLSACDRGEVHYTRSDGKSFEDPIHELLARGILLISRNSFDAWVVAVDGHNPLPPRPRKRPPYPWGADPGELHFDETQWAWKYGPAPDKPTATPTAAPPATPAAPPWQSSPVPLPSAPTPPSESADEDKEAEPPVDAKPDYDTYLSEAELRELGVPTDEIVAAFPVEPNRLNNEKWWKERMGNISRANKRLAVALVQKGLPNRGGERFPSWWRPDLVARWLIDAQHMPVYRVAPILRKEFPAWAKIFDAE